MEAKAALYEKMARGEIEGETLYVTACEQDMLKCFVIFLFHLFYPYFIFFLPSFVEDEDDDEEGGRFLVDFHKKIYSKVWQEINVIFFSLQKLYNQPFCPSNDTYIGNHLPCQILVLIHLVRFVVPLKSPL